MNAPERREEGSVLIIALIFLTTMSLVIGALVQLASVDLRNTVGTRDHRNTVYAADAAVQSAINTYRQNHVCPLATQAPAVNGKTVTVSCSATASTLPGGPRNNQPPLAVMALTTNPAEVAINGASSASTKVTGGVYGGTNIYFPPSSTLDVTGPAYAKAGCSTKSDGTTLNVTATAAGGPDCSYSGTYTDPAYDPLPLPTTTRTPPTCSAGGAPVFFDQIGRAHV